MPRIPLPISYDGSTVRPYRFRTCDGMEVDVWANDEREAVATFLDSHEYESRGWWKGMFHMKPVVVVDCGGAR
jgi:hypothetical protein